MNKEIIVTFVSHESAAITPNPYFELGVDLLLANHTNLRVWTCNLILKPGGGQNPKSSLTIKKRKLCSFVLETVTNKGLRHYLR